MNARKILFDLLCVEQSRRPTRFGFDPDPIDNLSVPSWVLAERRAVLAKVNEIRRGNGLAPIDETTLARKAEWLACGHSDYTMKYALYAAELTQRAAD